MDRERYKSSIIGRFTNLCVMAVIGFVSQSGAVHAQGIYLVGTGAINVGMAGTGVAAPLDSAGALNLNPASISGLSRSDMSIGFGMLLPTETISSSVPGLSGSTQGQPGVSGIPVMSFVQKSASSPWTWGIAAAGIGGFSSNYASSALAPGANPVLLPQAAGGIGALYANAQIFQITPTISYAVSEKFSVGVSPMLDIAQIQASPLLFAAPAGPGNTYLPGTNTRYAFGAGFQAGMYYVTDYDVKLGFSARSPQWFEPLRYDQQTATGTPIVSRVNFNLPTVLSWGTAYTGFDRWLLACDLKYYDYHNALGFRNVGYNSNGSLSGLGWNSIMSVSTAAQYRVTQKLMLRGGYAFFQNPIPASREAFNVATPLILHNIISVGGTYLFKPNVMGSIAYLHGFQASQTGPIITAAGTVPASSLTNTVSADQLMLGLNVLF
jgi:long-chain fatty acid transport protein